LQNKIERGKKKKNMGKKRQAIEPPPGREPGRGLVSLITKKGRKDCHGLEGGVLPRPRNPHGVP